MNPSVRQSCPWLQEESDTYEDSLRKGGRTCLLNRPRPQGRHARNQPQPRAETGAPPVNNVQINDNTVVLGPFNTPGIYHLYCTVHPGMTLTVIVQ
jgi:hypothetical protein